MPRSARSLGPLACLAAFAAAPSLGVAQAAPPAAASAQPPSRGTDVWVAQLYRVDGAPSLGRPKRVTNADGYHNQPAFTADGRSVLYSAAPGGAAGAPPDIYRYDIRARVVERLTNTPESEYSPAPVPGGRRHFTVVRVERDSAQRLWRLNGEGLVVTPVLPRERRVAYYVWADSARMVLALLDSGGLSLHVADAATGRLLPAARNVGRSIQRVPGRGTVSFVQRDSAGALWLTELVPATGRTARLIRLPDGVEHHAWLPDGTVLAGSARGLLFARPGAKGVLWRAIAVPKGARGLVITRIAVSPRWDRVAFVAERR